MSTAPSTQQQEVIHKIVSALREAEKRILPARLVDPAAEGLNGFAIAGYIQSKQLNPLLPETYEEAIKELVGSLQWIVKPAILTKREQNDKQRNQRDVQKESQAFIEQKNASEAADAKAKADAENIKKARAAVAGYAPIDRRTQKIAFGKQGTVQTYLNKYIEEQVARKADTASVLANVLKHIDELYSKDERAAARV